MSRGFHALKEELNPVDESFDMSPIVEEEESDWVERVPVQVRVMWSYREKKGDADAVLKVITEALEKAGYRVVVSGRYGNRRNGGGRVYLKVWGGGK